MVHGLGLQSLPPAPVNPHTTTPSGGPGSPCAQPPDFPCPETREATPSREIRERQHAELLNARGLWDNRILQYPRQPGSFWKAEGQGLPAHTRVRRTRVCFQSPGGEEQEREASPQLQRTEPHVSCRRSRASQDRRPSQRWFKAADFLLPQSINPGLLSRDSHSLGQETTPENPAHGVGCPPN